MLIERRSALNVLERFKNENLEIFACKYKVEDGGMSRGSDVYVSGFWRRSRETL